MSYSGRFILWTAVAVTLGIAASAGSQTTTDRVAVTGSLGRGEFWGEESSLGVGASVSGGVDLRLSERWSFELDLTGYSHLVKFDSGVRFSGDGVIVSGNALYHFSGTRSQPFLLVGLARVRSQTQSRFPVFEDPLPLLVDGELRFPEPIGEETFDYARSNWGMSLGGGIDIVLTRRLALRPEVRVITLPTPIQRVAAVIGVAYRW